LAEGFRAAATPGVTTATTGTSSATLPGSVMSGDFLLAIFGCGATTGTVSLSGGPGGWTQIDFQQNAGGTVALYTKTAGSSDASSTVTATASAATGTSSFQIVAYAGCDPYNPVLIFSSLVESSSMSALTTPAVSTTIDGAMTINVALLKTAAATWSIPSSYVVRSTATSPSGTAVPGGVIFDDNRNNDLNSITSSTTYGGQTATCSLSAGHGYVASISLLPATVSVLPDADVSNPGNWTATPSGSLWSAIGTYPVSFSDLITSPSVPSAAAYTGGLAACPSPGINTGFALIFWAQDVSASSGSIVVTFYNGATVVTTWTITLTSSWVQYVLPFTQGEAAGIQGSSTLAFSLSATAS
jgi:hypothetical protein